MNPQDAGFDDPFEIFSLRLMRQYVLSRFMPGAGRGVMSKRHGPLNASAACSPSAYVRRRVDVASVVALGKERRCMYSNVSIVTHDLEILRGAA
jgi:hypothetical protein